MLTFSRQIAMWVATVLFFVVTAPGVETVNTDAAALAIEDMAKAWPQQFDAARARAALVAYNANSNEASCAAVRAALLANPLLDFDRLLVLRRGFPKPAAARKAMGRELGVGSLNAHTSDDLPREGHWNDEFAVLSNLRGEPKFTTLYKPEGQQSLLDPVLHFDADKLLFAKRSAKETHWRVWEIGVDGKNLRQITPDDGNDVAHFDPCYLPDGRIIFASTAVYQGLPCEFGGQAMTCLYQLDPKTGSIRQLTFEQDSDWCPTVLNNGRVMYLRWEYTDQSHSNSRMLFHMNPDGTDQREYRGSGSWFPGSFFYAKPIPGDPHRVVGIAGGHHGTPRSGRLLILDPAEGRRNAEGIVQEIPGRGKAVEPIVRDRLVDGVWPLFMMPWPLSEKYFLVAAKLTPQSLWGIYLVDVFDNMTLIKAVEGDALLWPLPLQKRTMPPVIPDRVNLAKDTADVVIADVNTGPGLEGVPRGAVKNLRVIEYYFSRRSLGGLYGTIGLDGPWDVKRILGTVPVEADGSAHFTIPANSPISLQPVDEKGQALQLMRSWMVGMPGEKVSCIGCHENQSGAPVPGPSVAQLRAPTPIEPWHGPARGFSFVREVQPVLDRYCVSCHDGSKPDRPYFKGDLMLTNWTSQMSGRWGGGGKFSESYFQLQRYLRRPGIEGDRRMFTPLEFHFTTTELGQILRKGHHGVNLDAEAWERLTAWHDLNAPFFGTWGEIPGIGCIRATNLQARATELRKHYVPMGPFPDYEAVPETPKYDTTPVKPAEISNLKSQISNPAGWPFPAEDAIRKQKESLPAGSNGRLVLLDSPKPKSTFLASCRYLRIEAGPARWLSMAEAEVFAGGKNVALNKHATQSSTYPGGDATHAVDGNTDGVYGNGSMTHTHDGKQEWWEVDLGETCPVEKIVLWNRTDCASERLAACKVSLLDEKRQCAWSTTTPADAGRNICIGESARGAPGLEFARIPAGEFLMGSADGHEDEQPVSAVKIPRGYWMSRFEISNEQFRRFNPKHESRTEDRHGYQFGALGYDEDQPDQPAVRVSWDEAMEFCAWLSKKTGRRVTLPTEAQWEWACRAGAATPFFFGDLQSDYSPFANLGDKRLQEFAADTALAGYSQQRPMKNPNRYDDWIPRDDRFNDGGFVTEPPGKYKPNPWGLCDMHGNAAEWTRSSYRPYPYRDDDGRNAANPGEEKVVRGGSWYDRPFRCTASYRVPYRPWQRAYNTGLRVIVED